jgi:NADH-quinone oxidoreductase subunit E
MSELEGVPQAVSGILDKYNKDRGQLVSILQDVQAEYNYLPREALQEVSRGLDVPLSQVFGVATFFRAFSLKPRGRHSVHVCLGTACHVRGAVNILEQMETEMKVCCGGTTEDKKFTLESVNCVGACALGPVVVVDGEYAGQMTVNKVKPLLESYD